MAIRSTTDMGVAHEEQMVKIYGWDNARRSRSSGASFHDPIDVSTDQFVMECESTEKASYSFKLKFWDEVRKKAYNSKVPLIGIRFYRVGQKPLDFVLMDANDHSEREEILQRYREKYGEI